MSLIRRKASRSGPRCQDKRSVKPWLETLEDRSVPSGFSDDFEGATLNSFWSTRTDSGSVTFPSTAQVHGGSQSVQLNSTQTGVDKGIWLSHTFPSAVYGRFSVWMYDMGADVSSSNAMSMFLYGPNGSLGHAIYVPDYDLGPGGDGSTYVWQVNEVATRSSVDRTKAWHQFSIETRPDGTTYKIDGITVGTHPTGIVVNQVGLYMYAPSWRPAFTSYWDDFEYVPDLPVNTYTTGPQISPQVAVDSAGNSAVIWQSLGQDGSDRGIYGQRFNAAGVPLGGEFRVNTTTTGSQAQPEVAMDAAGNFVVVWDGNGPGDNEGIFAQRINAAGNRLGGEFRVNTYTTNTQTDASVAMDAAGNFVITWSSYDQDGSVWGILGQRFDSSGNRLGGEFRVNTATRGNQDGSKVAMNDQGAFVVSWSSSTGPDGWDIFARRYNAAGVALGDEFLVNTATTGNQFRNGVALTRYGEALFTWTGRDSDGSGVFGRRFGSSGQPLGGEFRINATTSGDQFSASVGADNEGNFVLTWAGAGPDDSHGIFSRVYLSDGTPLGSEIRVNPVTTGDQDGAQVGVAPDGRYLIAWNGAGPGDSNGIFARWYSAPVLPPKAVHSVAINDGSAQRSKVNSITITFSGVVTLPAGAFELYRQNGTLVGVQVSTQVSNGRTVAVLTFTGAGILGGSLADGNYRLVVRADRILDRQGTQLDGDGNGAAGGDRIETFFRLFGDANGDRQIDEEDLVLLDAAYASFVGDARYRWYFDFGGDGDIDATDFFAFERRYGTRLNP